MDKVSNLNSNEILKIVVRKREYIVSKKFICSSVPYFEKMFCCDLLESKENKVILDFDEHVFDAILNWIHSGFFIIEMETVISFYEAADYLMINDRLLEHCLSYFRENFTIEHIPVVLPQVTRVSKLISSGSIENFICRHFLLIANTNVFLDYPVHIVETILKMDLMINSEYEIFRIIIKWINKKINSRKGFLIQLLECVRWNYMSLFDKAVVEDNELVKTLSDPDSIISSIGEYEFNRSEQSFFISIHRIDDSRIRLNVFDKDLFCLPIGYFIKDDSMSLELVDGEHISDVLFDSGSKGVRIDWNKHTFKWLDFNVKEKNYYSQLNRLIAHGISSEPKSFILEEKDSKLPSTIGSELLLLEADGHFITIGKTEDKGLFYLVAHENCLDYYQSKKCSFHATILKNVIYILTKDLEFIQFDYKIKHFKKSKPFKEELGFDHLILTSHLANDEKVILIDKESGKIRVYYIYEDQWIERYRIMNLGFGSEGSIVNAGRLIAFTSTLLCMKNIKPLFERNSSSPELIFHLNI